MNSSRKHFLKEIFAAINLPVSGAKRMLSDFAVAAMPPCRSLLRQEHSTAFQFSSPVSNLAPPCSPSRGAGRRMSPGVFENFTGRPIVST